MLEQLTCLVTPKGEKVSICLRSYSQLVISPQNLNDKKTCQSISQNFCRLRQGDPGPPRDISLSVYLQSSSEL